MELICPFCKNKTEIDGCSPPQVFKCPECNKISIDIGKKRRTWFSITGRVSRGDFLVRIILWFLISLGFGLLLGLFLGASGINVSESNIFYIALIFGIIVQIDLWGLYIRRFHDFDWHGRSFIVIYLNLLICFIWGDYYLRYEKGIFDDVISIVQWEAFWYGSHMMLFLMLSILPGTNGVNRFGAERQPMTKISVGDKVKFKFPTNGKNKIALKSITKKVIENSQEEAVDVESSHETPKKNN